VVEVLAIRRTGDVINAYKILVKIREGKAVRCRFNDKLCLTQVDR
jgi:hypothetical protein